MPLLFQQLFFGINDAVYTYWYRYNKVWPHLVVLHFLGYVCEHYVSKLLLLGPEMKLMFVEIDFSGSVK